MADNQDSNNFANRLAAARQQHGLDSTPDETPSSGAAFASGLSGAMRLSMELVVATGVGFGLGYWLDKWLGTSPLLAIIFALLGIMAGFFNLYRAMTGQSYKVGAAFTIDLAKTGNSATKPSDEP